MCQSAARDCIWRISNNLYGWALSQPLPTSEFDWLTNQEIAELNVTDVADNNEEGYILEVDLHNPKALHGLHNNYPLAPEKIKISSNMLSPYCQGLSGYLDLGGNGVVPKLIPNLQNKTKYRRTLSQFKAILRTWDGAQKDLSRISFSTNSLA